jgi:hypothetical protein
MWAWAILPFAIHALAMAADEAWFHRRRGLPRWERWGHPADTATVLLCYAIALFLDPTRGNLILYAAAAGLSLLFVTKDEWIHARLCGGGETWLHAFLFTLHPVLLFLVGAHWQWGGNAGGSGVSGTTGSDGSHAVFAAFLAGQAVLTALFMTWQIAYWNGPWAPPLLPEAAGPSSAKTRGSPRAERADRTGQAGRVPAGEVA